MAIPHAAPGQVVDVGPLGQRLASERTVALFKSAELEVIRLILQAGRSLPPHKVPGEITIHCIEGAIAVTSGGERHDLRAGQLLFLPGGAEHDVVAIEDAMALVTIVVRRG